MERKQTFHYLKKPCVELIQSVASLEQRPTAKKEVIQALSHLLRTLQEVTAEPDSLDAKLAEYVFVPISQVLRASRTAPIHALELCLECISVLLNTGWKANLSPELSAQLLILFTFLANPSLAENGLPATSEELQAAAFKCMTELLDEASSTVRGRQSLTTTATIPTLGKAVLVMLDSLTESTSNDVKSNALAALKALSSAVDNPDALASFLPRMVSSLTKVLTPSSDNKVSFRLLHRGLDTLSLLFLRVLSDQQTKDLPTAGDDDLKGEKVQRSTSWLQATAGQIKIALANVVKLRHHDKKEVRHALFQLCLRVIQDCRKSLSESISMMIETLITLTGRGNERDSVEKDLQVLLYSDPKLAELLRESLHGWVISLPRLMQSKDDIGRRQIIHQVSVTYRLLSGQQINLTRIDDLMAANLRDSVSNVLNDSKGHSSVIEFSDTNAIETDLILSGNRSTSFQPLSLQFKGQNETMDEFNLLLQQLARSDSALPVAQNLVSFIHSGRNETRLASFWLSLKLLQGVTSYGAAIEDFLDLSTPNIRVELLDELYSFSLTTLTNPDFECDLHWRFQALALEVVALQAKQHKEDFRFELIDALYPVIHLLGSPNPTLRDHAVTCLNIMAECCGYTSSGDLVVENVDYLVNDVALKLNYHDISPQAPQVLLMMMRLCGPSLLPYLDDLIGSIFSALERFHGYPKLVELLFSVLKGMAEEGVKAPQLAITSTEETIHHKAAWHGTTLAEVVQTITVMKAKANKQDERCRKVIGGPFPHRSWKNEAEDDPKDQSMDQNALAQDEAAQPVEPPPPAPKTFNIILKISELTQHYLTSSSPTLRTSLLSLLNTTIPALAKHENSFLSLINTLWPVLLPRLDDTEAYVVSNTLDIISLISTYAGDFMKGRIEGTWEVLQTVHRRTVWTAKKPNQQSGKTKALSKVVLLAQAHNDVTVSAIETNVQPARREYYVDAPTRLIWDSLVRLLSTIVEHVAVREEIFDDILDMLDSVLERSGVRKALDSRNPDAVWLRQIKKGNCQVVEQSTTLFASIAQPSTTGQPRWDFIKLQVR